MIGITAVITPHANTLDEVRQGLIDVAEKVKASEPGCLRYKITEQTNAEGTPEFIVIEEYKDEAAVNDHMNAEYFQELAKMVEEKKLLAKPLDIKRTKVVGGYDSK